MSNPIVLFKWAKNMFRELFYWCVNKYPFFRMHTLYQRKEFAQDVSFYLNRKFTFSEDDPVSFDVVFDSTCDLVKFSFYMRNACRSSPMFDVYLSHTFIGTGDICSVISTLHPSCNSFYGDTRGIGEIGSVSFRHHDRQRISDYESLADDLASAFFAKNMHHFSFMRSVSQCVLENWPQEGF